MVCLLVFSHRVVSDPMDCSMPGLPAPHHFPVIAQVHVHCIGDAIQPCHPLSPPSPLALNLSQHQGLVQRVGCSHQVAKRLELQHQSIPMNIQGWFPSRLTEPVNMVQKKRERLESEAGLELKLHPSTDEGWASVSSSTNTGSNTFTEWDWECSTYKHPLRRAVGFYTSFSPRAHTSAQLQTRTHTTVYPRDSPFSPMKAQSPWANRSLQSHQYQRSKHLGS